MLNSGGTMSTVQGCMWIWVRMGQVENYLEYLLREFSPCLLSTIARVSVILLLWTPQPGWAICLLQ